MTTSLTSPWLTINEAIKYSKRSRSALMRSLADGSLVGNQKKRGGMWLIHVEDLDAWIRGEVADVKPQKVARRRSA